MAEAAPVSEPKDAEKKARERVDKLLALAPSVSQGSITLGGRKMAYEAQAAFIPVSAEGSDDPDAAVMTTSYVLSGAKGPQRRVIVRWSLPSRLDH